MPVEDVRDGEDSVGQVLVLCVSDVLDGWMSVRVNICEGCEGACGMCKNVMTGICIYSIMETINDPMTMWCRSLGKSAHLLHFLYRVKVY